MSGPPSSRSPLRGARGAVSWVTLLAFVLAVSGVYLGWVWVPLYLDHYAVKQAVRASMNQAIKDTDDAALVRRLCEKIRGIRMVDGLDGYGRKVPVPAVMLEEPQVSWTRDTVANPPTVRVTFEYEREVVYPFIDRTSTKTFVVEDSSDISPVKW
jgi:hypothetical protein